MTRKCFVSIPGGKKTSVSGQFVDFDQVYSELIAPAVRSCGYEPCRTLDFFGNGSIMDVAVRLLAESELMIADLTTLNPNVIHEVGMRQAFLPTGLLLTIGFGDRLPFNLNHTFVHHYRDLTPDTIDHERSRMTWSLKKIIDDNSPNPIYRQARWARDYDEYRVALQEFHAFASFERSIFVMTKFPEPDVRRQTDDDRKLERVINKVREAVSLKGYTARLAIDKSFDPVLWKNIEIYLIGCSKGIAIVEDKFGESINPNVAMEWGWMRSSRKNVLYLLEKKFENRKADFEGFLYADFSWDFPEEDVAAAVAKWLPEFNP
jgi:hypothetical protein